MVTVFLHISHAFDAVWHHGLLTKVYAAGIKGEMAHFISDFIKDRKIKVSINSEESRAFEMKAGVPQGLVLSPSLYAFHQRSV